ACQSDLTGPVLFRALPALRGPYRRLGGASPRHASGALQPGRAVGGAPLLGRLAAPVGPPGPRSVYRRWPSGPTVKALLSSIIFRIIATSFFRIYEKCHNVLQASPAASVRRPGKKTRMTPFAAAPGLRARWVPWPGAWQAS